MKLSGCREIMIGVESVTDHILESMNKKTTFSKIHAALEAIRRSRIALITSNFIFGDVLDDQETIDSSIEWWRTHRQYPLDLVIIFIYPGTQLYRLAIETGKITDEVAYLRGNCEIFNLSKLTEQQYKELNFRISTEKANHTHSPRAWQIVGTDFAERKTRLRYSCACGHEGEVWARGILVSDTFVCPGCGQTYNVPLHESYSTEVARRSVDAFAARHGAIAFWGIGIEMQALLRKIGADSREDVVLVDREPRKQGLQILNHTIEPPEALLGRGIKVAIVTPIDRRASRIPIDVEISRFGVSAVVQLSALLQLTTPASVIGERALNSAAL
jgi:hypothetical protein